uniref:Uncharacterized protein n=1 Tax=Acrobeloides nanus TaxID=290746 RepID=A0A914DRD7_9BILA
EQYQNALNKAQDTGSRESFSLKDEQIEALYSRIRYLESVIQQKEDRINALTKQVEKLLEIAYRDNGSHQRNPTDTPPSSEGQSSAYPTDTSSPFRESEPYDSYDLK